MFLQIGFPGLHPPYDPTPDALAAYADVDIPVPSVSEAELLSQPPAQQQLRDNMIELNFDSIAWRRDLSQADLLRLRRHYAANVSMIDHQVCRILAALDARGYLDNALVIFTSDHADALGEHGHIQKWTMYDLQSDPDECHNLLQAEALRAMRDELSAKCLGWLARGSLFANRLASRASQQAMRI